MDTDELAEILGEVQALWDYGAENPRNLIEQCAEETDIILKYEGQK